MLLNCERHQPSIVVVDLAPVVQRRVGSLEDIPDFMLHLVQADLPLWYPLPMSVAECNLLSWMHWFATARHSIRVTTAVSHRSVTATTHNTLHHLFSFYFSLCCIALPRNHFKTHSIHPSRITELSALYCTHSG